MEPFIGMIVQFGGNFAPRAWALCDGQLLAIASNTALFSILGTTFGGDGRTTFGLPEMRGRVPVHSGNGSTGPGLSSRSLGEKGGAETVTLTANQIPAHHHSFQAGTGKAGGTANGGFLADTNEFDAAAGGGNLNVGTIGNTGGGQSHTNMQPWIAINFIIALQGTYPSRS